MEESKRNVDMVNGPGDFWVEFGTDMKKPMVSLIEKGMHTVAPHTLLRLQKSLQAILVHIGTDIEKAHDAKQFQCCFTSHLQM